MAFGVTPEGFVLKRLEDVKADIQAALRATFGPGINLREDELLGQIVGILAERDALIWEALEAVYFSEYPSYAEGVNLDNVVEITGIKRLEATKGTGSGIAYGILGTIIPAGSIVSVDGNPDARFVTLADAEIAAGTDEIQDIDFSAVPDAGDWTLQFDGEETGVLAFNDNAAAVQAALNALPNLSGVTVAGNYAAGFTITFAGADGEQDQPMIQASENNLTNTGNLVNLTFTETTPGALPNVTIELEAETAGFINAYADSLTVIETPVAGWQLFNNPADIDPGRDIETDAALRIRRNRTLATAGAATVEAIRARLLEIDEVEDVVVFENIELVPDGAGRPGKSIEAVVLGGDEQEIADELWLVAPAGIERFGNTDVDITDSQGFVHTMSFSRPTEIEIFMIINLTVNADFPAGGDDVVKQKIVDWANENLGIADDVITVKFFCPINEVAGIEDIEILLGVVDPPVGSANIVIGDTEIAVFDTTRIEVNT